MIYNNKTGNLRPFCFILTHEARKALILLTKTGVQKHEKRLRLPLVDSIGLNRCFMVKNKHRQTEKQEVADLALQAIVNKRFINPAIGENSALDAD